MLKNKRITWKTRAHAKKKRANLDISQKLGVCVCVCTIINGQIKWG